MIQHRFETLEELAASVRGWDLDLTQMSRDESASELTQVRLGPVALTHFEAGCRHVQQGASPVGAVTFGMLADGAQSVRWCGSALAPNLLPYFDGGQEFEATAYPRFNIYTLTIDPADLDPDQAWQLFMNQMGQSGSPRRCLLVSGDVAVSRLRRLIASAHRFACSESFFLADPKVLEELGHDILTALLRVIGIASQARDSLSAAARSRALNKALEFIGDQPGEPMTLNQLCEASRVSERTLQRAFLERFGVTPKTYLQAIRLNGVHRNLIRCARSDSLVGDAAKRWGFWHMSQFAEDYKRLFGELPSQTLAKPPLEIDTSRSRLLWK